MEKTNRFQSAMVFVLLLSLMVMLTGCFPSFPKNSSESDSKSDKNSVLENAKPDNDNAAIATANRIRPAWWLNGSAAR